MSLKQWVRSFHYVNPDPELNGIRKGFLAAASLGLALLVMRILLPGGKPITVLLFSAVVGMQSAVSVNDNEPRQQAFTNVLLPFVSAVVVAIAALISHHTPLNEIVFVFVMSGAVWVRRFGDRYTAAGMIGFMSYFFAIFLGATTSMVPRLVLGAFVGCAASGLLRFTLFREHPERGVRRLIGEFDRRARYLLDAVNTSKSTWPLDEMQRRSLRKVIDDLDETALDIEDRLDSARYARSVGDPSGLESALFDAELYATRLVNLVQIDETSGERFTESLSGLNDQLNAINGVRIEHNASDGAMDTVDESSPPDDHAVLGQRLSPATRSAVQVGLTGALTIVAGHLLSGTRWYWAVISGFMIYVNAPSSAANVKRAFGRLVGTGAGIVGGLLIAEALKGDATIEFILIIVSVLIAFSVVSISYGATVFFFTVVLSLLYSLLGTLSNSLLLLRLEETLVGVVIAGVVAVLLLPRSGNTVIDESIEAMLIRSERLVDVLQQIKPGGPKPHLRSLIRNIDRAFLDIRDAVLPTVTRVPVGRSRLRRRDVFMLSGMRHRLRALAAGVERGEFAMTDTADLLARVRKDLESAHDTLTGHAVNPVQHPDPNFMPEGTREQRLLQRIDYSIISFIEYRTGS